MHFITKYVFLFMLSFWVIPSFLYAQQTSLDDVFQQLAEDDESTNYNLDELLEDFYDRYQQPVNINAATREQLEFFTFLTDLQIEHLLAYIYIHGEMKTLYELALVEDMDRKTIELLTPFIYAAPLKSRQQIPLLKHIFRYGKQELLTRFDYPFYTRKGYEKNYLGTKYYHSARYSFRYRDKFYAGVTAEKDAGEPMFALHNVKGYDYYSPYIYLKDFGRLKTLALGNYRLSYGQGLVISQDFALGKSTSLSTVQQRSTGIKRHASTDEYNYLQGAALAIQSTRFTFSGFYSYRKLDAIVKEGYISSIQKTGLHRTQTEADRRGAAAMQLLGGHIEYAKNRLKLGLTGIYYFFDRPYDPTLREYSKYNMHGNYFSNVGFNYAYLWKRFSFRGEVATDKNGRYSTVNSINYNYRQRYELMLLHRYYDYRYWSWFGRSFSESGYVQNENGWYAAIEARPIRYWTFFLSADFFSFPWWRYGIDAPSQGYDLQWKATFTPRDNLSMFVRYRYKRKDKNYTGEDKVKSVRPLHQHRTRFQLNYTPLKDLSLRTVADFNQVNPQGVEASRGYSLLQSLSYSLPNYPFRVEIQSGYFHTDDYSSRIYMPEKGLLNTFYTPSFYGKGYRLVAFLRYDPNKHLMIIAKYGQTYYSDRTSIGSGNDEIAGNSKRDLQIQVRVKW